MKYYTLLLTLFMSITIAACHSGEQNSKSSEPISVLIVDGFSNHDWRATTNFIKSLISKDAHITVGVSTVPYQQKDEALWQAWLPRFTDYDVVIQNTNDINNGHSWPKPAQAAFESYMQNGGSMLVLHSANNAFPKWEEYNRMIGLGWRKQSYGNAIIIEDGKPVRIPAGEGGSTGHGKRVNTLVTRIGDHPIHSGLPQQWMAADLEIYRYARGPAENIQILSYANEEKTKLNFPIEWTITYGKGRVYNSTYGHFWHTQKEAPPGMRCAAFQTLFLRAIYWLANKEVDSTAPVSFPSAQAISLNE